MRLLLLIILALFLDVVVAPSLPCSLECRCGPRTADCKEHALRVLPVDLNTDIRALDLSYNLFTSIPQNLSLFPNLQILALSHNLISLLGADALQNILQLTHLDLSYNLILRPSDIHQDSLLPAPLLRHIDLSFNHIKTLPNFRSSSLQSLVLTNCSLVGLNINYLQIWPNLQTLQISSNKFQVLSKMRATNLKTLNISFSQIQRVEVNALDSMPSLTHLYLTCNYKLKEFGANSPSLSLLDLSECNLESVPRSILPNLTTLGLSGNHIRKLGLHTFSDMSNVQKVNLSDNSIDSIDLDAFQEAVMLQDLDLSRNTISTIDGATFLGNKHLQSLRLSRNYFQTMVQLRSSSLSNLDLSHCEITHLRSTSLTGMVTLKDLNLSGNQIISLPMDLTSNSLERLHLANCRLTGLKNETFRRMPRVRYLNVEGNRLVDLQFGDFENLGIRSIRLGDNPWRCDCENKHFKGLHVALAKIDSDVANARCHTPENLEGMTWFDACGAKWYGLEDKGDKTWMISLCLMLVLFIGCCGFISVHRECKRRQTLLAEEEARQETRERLMVMIQAVHAHDHEDTNAPDPRELERPPSYHEAIAMPALGSTLSLDSSKIASSVSNNNNLEGAKHKAKKRRRRRSGHRTSQSSINNVSQNENDLEEVTRSNPDLLDKDRVGVKGTPRRTRRRKRSRSVTRSQNLESTDSDRESYVETDI